jgi:hypothetical protein
MLHGENKVKFTMIIVLGFVVKTPELHTKVPLNVNEVVDRYRLTLIRMYSRFHMQSLHDKQELYSLQNYVYDCGTEIKRVLVLSEAQQQNTVCSRISARGLSDFRKPWSSKQVLSAAIGNFHESAT